MRSGSETVFAKTVTQPRRNLTNTGKAYEKLFAITATAYERKGLLRLCKVDPPVRMVRGRVIFLPNPHLDFVGCWSERGGRMLCLEVKSTAALTLDMRPSQRESMRHWQEFGAVVALVWYRFDGCRIAWPQDVVCSSPMRWDGLEEVKSGPGWVVFDWLDNLRKRY